MSQSSIASRAARREGLVGNRADDRLAKRRGRFVTLDFDHVGDGRGTGGRPHHAPMRRLDAGRSRSPVDTRSPRRCRPNEKLLQLVIQRCEHPGSPPPSRSSDPNRCSGSSKSRRSPGLVGVSSKRRMETVEGSLIVRHRRDHRGAHDDLPARVALAARHRLGPIRIPHSGFQLGALRLQRLAPFVVARRHPSTSLPDRNGDRNSVRAVPNGALSDRGAAVPAVPAPPGAK